MPYDFRFRNPYAEAEEYSRRVKEDLVRVMNKPPLPKGPAPFQQLDKESVKPGFGGPSREVAVSAVSGKKSDKKLGFFEQIGASWKAGEALEVLTEIDAERVKRNDPNYGKAEEEKALKKLDKYQHGLPDADYEYAGVRDALTNKNFYKSLVVSLPLMDDIMGRQILRSLEGTALMVGGAAAAATGTVGGIATAPTGIGAAGGAGLAATGITAMTAGAAMHGYAAAEATREESELEMGGIYRDVFDKLIEEGRSPEEAHKIAREAALKGKTANMAWIGATNAAEQVLTFGVAGGITRASRMTLKANARAAQAAKRAANVAGRAAGTMATESIQEGGQEVIGQWATGEKVDPFAPEVRQAALSGGVMGGAFFGLGSASSAITRRALTPREGVRGPEGPEGPEGSDPTTTGSTGSKFPRIEEIDPILTENYYARIMESTSDEIKTLINNRVSNYMEAGMDQDEATFEALGNMMEQDTDFRDMVYGAYVETLGEYQTQGEEQFNRFAAYGAVLNSLPPEQREFWQGALVDLMRESGDTDGRAAYEAVMAAVLETPEGAAALENIGLQDGTFWRRRTEELMNERVVRLSEAPFTDRVEYFENSLADPNVADVEVATELIYRIHRDDLSAGIDLIDTLYDNGKVDRGIVDRVIEGYTNKIRLEQPELLTGPSPVQQELEQGRREIQYARNLKKYASFVPKHSRAVKGQTPEQSAVQRELEGAIKGFIGKNPVLAESVADLDGAHAIIAEPTAEQAKVQELIKKAFGHDVVFFEANPLIQENGAPSGIFDKETGTIFVNIKSKNPAMAVIGHELAHAMFVDGIFSKKFFGDFLVAVQNAGIKDAEYMDWLFQSLNSSEELTAESIEMAGDIMGHALNSEEFWSSLRKQSPRAFEQFYNALKKIVAEIKAVFTDVAPAHDMQQIFTEFDSLVSMAEKVAAEYSKHQQSRAVVRTHSVTTEGMSGYKSQKQTFFVYDKETDQPIWRADVPGAAGRAEALEVARRINQGEAAPEDIVDEYGEVEAVRKKGETDKKLAKEKAEIAEAEAAKEAEMDAFAPGTIHANRQGKEVVVLEQKEDTVKVKRTDIEEGQKGGNPYWISKKHLTPVKEKAPETPAKKTFLGISVDVFRKSMAETEEETVEGFRESLSEADHNDYRDLCDGLLGSNLNEKELGNAIEWFEEAYNYLSDILNMSETMSMGERPAYMEDRSEIRSSIKALKEALAKKSNTKIDDSPFSYDVYSEELAEELIDYLFETDPKDGLYPWKWIQKKIEEEPFTDEALSKKSKDELDANLRYMDAIDRFAASVGAEEGSYLSDGSRVFDKEYTLKEYESEKEAALTVISDARSRIMRHIGGAKDSGSPTKPTLPTQEEVEDKILGEVFELDDHNRYYWYEIVDWAEEMANTEDPAAMQINLVYLEEAQKYAKGTQRSRDRVGERGFTEKYTPVMYNKERNEALDALNKAVKGLRKRVKALPQEEILTQEAGGPPTTPAPTTPEAPKKTKKPVEEPIDTAEEDIGPEVDEEAADAELDNEISSLLSELSSEGEGTKKASISKLNNRVSDAQRSADLLGSLLDELSDDVDIDAIESELGDDFEFQSDRRNKQFAQEISFYDRARAVVERTHPEALSELERVGDNKEAIRELLLRLQAQDQRIIEEQEKLAEQRRKEEVRRLNQRAEDLLAPEKKRKRANAKQMDKYNKAFQGIKDAVDKGKKLSPKQLEQLENIFIEYNEVMAPNSLEDSVPVRVMRRLGLDLDIGIDMRRNPLTGENELRYYWSVSGNIATYGQELTKLGARYNEQAKWYEWTSDNPANSPLGELLNTFGGNRYVQEAQRREISVSDDARGAITGFPRRTDVARRGRSVYSVGSKENPKQLLITKGIRTNKRAEVAISKHAWDKTLKEHQKDGISLAVEGLDNYGAFILADGTGAGKTAQILAVAEHYSRQGDSVLLVLHNEESFREAFMRDAKMLDIPENKMRFLKGSKGSEKRGVMRKGPINAIAYNYVSLLNEDPELKGLSLEEKLTRSLGMKPDLVIFDEAHNMKNVLKEENFKALGGTELSRMSKKAMFVTATIAESPEQLPYLEKLGFMNNFKYTGDESKGLNGFMEAMGYVFVQPKSSKRKPYWMAPNLEYTNAQLDLFYNELADAGLLLKRELSLDGVTVRVRKYEPHEAAIGAMDAISEIIHNRSMNPRTKATVLMAQRRYLETQKIQATYDLALEELEKGRQVIIFGELVNPTNILKEVRNQLLRSPEFVDQARQAAIESKRPFATYAQKQAFVENFIVEELERRQVRGEIPDGPGSLTELYKKFNIYFNEQQDKQGLRAKYSQVARIFGSKEVKSDLEGFQSGVMRVALATIQKGGTSLSLDDQHGNMPRTVIFMTPPFSAIDTMQALGRAWRLSTMSNVNVVFLKADHPIDDWGFDIVYKKLGMLGAIGQKDAVATFRALGSEADEGGTLSTLEHRKPSEPATEPGAIPEFQQDWRARQRATLGEADQTRSLQGLRQAHEEYYQGEAAEARERGDEVRAAEIEEVGQLAAEHVEVMESVRNDALDFFSFFGPQETQEQETRASDSKGKKKKDEGMWEYIRRVFGMRRNAETRELAYIPASELVEGGKGAGFSIDQGSLEKAGMEIQQSANNAELGPLERFLVKDNLMNVFLLGAVEYREKANGTPLTEAEKMKYRRMMLYYKSMKNGVDDKIALRLLEELACGNLNEADKSIYKLSRMYGGIESRTFYRLIDDFKETAELLTDGSGVYSEEMEEIVGKLATATHALEVNQFFRERAEHKTENASGFTDEAIQEIIDEANAKLKKLSRSQQEKARNAVGAITNFHSKVLDSLLEGEVITQKTYDTLRDAYSGYMPMFRQLKDNRVIDFDPTKPVKGSTSFEGTIEPLMGRKGSTRPIKDILTSSLEAYSRAVRAIEMNTILRQFDVIIEALKDAGLEGRFVKKHRDMPVLTDMYAIMEDGKEVPADNLTREDLESLGIGTVIRSKSKDAANYVVAKENGEVILYEAHPEVIEALQTMRKASQGDSLRKFTRKAGEVLRTGATVSPEFTAKNPIRDVFHGYITSDSGVGVKDIVECAVFMLGKRNNPRLQQLWKEFLEDGGGMGNILNDIIIRHNSFTKEVTGRKSAGDYSPIRGLQHLSHTAENISRFTEYTKARETGASRREAAFRAMDQQDFGMSGKAVRPINSVTPFFNSTIQGKYKLFRKFKENPKEFTYRMLWAQLPLTMVSLALRAMANDDQKRKIEEAHAYIRTNYWLIPVPGTNTVARIPKPFDVSMLVANAIESFYDYAMEKDPMTATDALSDWFLDNMRHVTLPNSIFPQLLNITMEARTGYNQFYGIDVVPSSLQDDMAMNQFTSSTPHLCIALGRAMGAVGLGDASFASPIRTQSIVNTTFGGLGTITLDLLDIAWNGLAKVAGATTYRDQVVGKRPHGDNWFANTLGVDVDRLPMARVFLQNTDYGKSIGEVYRKWERLKGQKKMYDRLLEAGQPKAALRAMPDKDWDLYWTLKETADIDNTFGPANSLIRTFRDTTHLSPTDKAYWMKEVGDDRARMARETLLFIRMYEAGLTPEALWEEALRIGGMSAEFKQKVKGFGKGFEKYVEERSKTRAAK